MRGRTEGRPVIKEDFKGRKSADKPQRLALEAIQEIKHLETVQQKRWRKPAKNG